jgi:acyl carrier protein
MAIPIATQVIAIIADQLGAFGEAEDVITPRATLVQDLGADSLDLMEIGLSLEDAFDLRITDDEIVAWSTVQDAIAFIEARVSKVGAQ